MSSKHSKFFKERQSRSWSFNDLMLGVETAQLSRALPSELKMLICNMSIGFPVYCLGAREAELNKNGIQNRRDMKCLVQKFSSEPPQNDNWTCWPCIDFLKKFNPEVWRERTGLRCIYNYVKNPQRFLKAPWMKNRTVCKIQRQLSEDDKNPVVLKLRFGEILISRDMNYHSPFYGESLGSGSNKLSRCPHVPKCGLQGNTNLCCLQSRKI